MTAFHLSPEQLLDLSDGAVPPSRASELHAHVSNCAHCHGVNAEMRQVSDILASASSSGPLFDVADAVSRLQHRRDSLSIRLNPAALLVGSVVLTTAAMLATVPNVRSVLGDNPATDLLDRLGIRIVNEGPKFNDQERVVVLTPEPLTEETVTARAPYTLLPEYLPFGYAFSHAFSMPGSVSLFYRGEPAQRPLEVVEIQLPIGPDSYVEVLEGKATPVQIGGLDGVFVDGAWAETRSRDGTQLAPAQWTSEFGSFLLFDRDGLRIYVFGPNSLSKEELVKVAESLK